MHGCVGQLCIDLVLFYTRMGSGWRGVYPQQTTSSKASKNSSVILTCWRASLSLCVTPCEAHKMAKMRKLLIIKRDRLPGEYLLLISFFAVAIERRVLLGRQIQGHSCV